MPTSAPLGIDNKSTIGERYQPRCLRGVTAPESFPQRPGLCKGALTRRRPLCGGTPLRHGFAVPPLLKERLWGLARERAGSPRGELARSA